MYFHALYWVFHFAGTCGVGEMVGRTIVIQGSLSLTNTSVRNDVQEEDPPALHWGEHDAASCNQYGAPRLHTSKEQGAFRSGTRTPSNLSRPGSAAAAAARPVSATVAPRPHSYSPVPPLNLHGRASASTTEDISFKQQLAIKQRTVKNRTIDRINGVARYRKYKALSESIAKSVPPGMAAGINSGGFMDCEFF